MPAAPPPPALRDRGTSGEGLTDGTLGKRGLSVTFGRRLGLGILVVTAAGCSTAPRSFQGIFNPAPIVRARAVSLGEGLPEGVVVPALIDRLSDPDPVVRMSAHEELKRGTGQDFGFVAWADPADRARAVGRWQQWWKAREAGLAQSRRSD